MVHVRDGKHKRSSGKTGLWWQKTMTKSPEFKKKRVEPTKGKLRLFLCRTRHSASNDVIDLFEQSRILLQN